MTHLLYDALLYLTHLIYHAFWFLCNIYIICSEFLVNFCAKLLYMCSIFYMIFVQFLGVIKCLNNPFFTICRIAHTKKPHRAKFLRSLTVTLEQSTQYRLGTSRTSPKTFARFNNTNTTLHISCVPYRCTRFRPFKGKIPLAIN